MDQPCRMPIPSLSRILLLCGLALLVACDNLPPVPRGRIEFRNLLSGSDHTTIYVSSGMGTLAVKAGQGLLLPQGTTNFTVSYDNGKRALTYTIQCPSDVGSGVRIRLIDIFQGRIGGGCVRVGKG